MRSQSQVTTYSPRKSMKEQKITKVSEKKNALTYWAWTRHEPTTNINTKFNFYCIYVLFVEVKHTVNKTFLKKKNRQELLWNVINVQYQQRLEKY